MKHNLPFFVVISNFILMVKGTLGLIFFSCLLALNVAGQSAITSPDGNTLPDSAAVPFKQQQHLQFGMTMGTGIAFATGAGGGMFTYLAPHLSYRVTPRFTISSGVQLETNSNNRLLYPSMENVGMPYYQPNTACFLYGSGTYHLTNRISLTGTVFGGNESFNYLGLSPQSYNLNTYGGGLNVGYKISDGASINAGIQVSRGPAYNNGLNNPVSPIR